MPSALCAKPFIAAWRDLAIACGLACSEIDELESGGSIDEAKLRRIANALKLPENIFSG